MEQLKRCCLLSNVKFQEAFDKVFIYLQNFSLNRKLILNAESKSFFVLWPRCEDYCITVTLIGMQGMHTVHTESENRF